MNQERRKLDIAVDGAPSAATLLNMHSARWINVMDDDSPRKFSCQDRVLNCEAFGGAKTGLMSGKI